MQVEIRAYEDADEAAVIALWKEVFTDTLAHNRPKDELLKPIVFKG